jgi:hypothetical protein
MSKRRWERGSPPPPGSWEWCGVADAVRASTVGIGLPKVYEISYTEVDAADRWMNTLWRSLQYARKIHGSRLVTDQDLRRWDELVQAWNKFRSGLTSWGGLRMMSSENRGKFDRFLRSSRELHEDLTRRGVATVPVPYMDELISLLRSEPKQMTALEMRARLEAGIRCGEQLLDENTAWYQWRKRDDSRGLTRALDEARAASQTYGALWADNKKSFPSTSLFYRSFVRVLTKIWIEAAGLYGVVETTTSARSEAADVARERAAGIVDTGSNYLLYVLATAGAGYLGYRWLNRKTGDVKISVRDAVPRG